MSMSMSPICHAFADEIIVTVFGRGIVLILRPPVVEFSAIKPVRN